jgi:hypothetical protein
MATQTFYLKIYTIDGRTRHSVALTEEGLEPVPRNADWQCYKLTIVDGHIDSLEKTDRLFTQPKVHTRTDRDLTVAIHKTTILLGAPWESLRSQNTIMLDLIDLMDRTLLVPSPDS